MEAIKKALENLGAAVGGLEGSIDALEANLAGQQRDMFPIQNGAVSNENVMPLNGEAGVSADILAMRLDQAIEKVEKILKEA